MRIDAHCDTAVWLEKCPSLRYLSAGHNDYQRCHDNLDLAFWAIFRHPQGDQEQIPHQGLTLARLLQKDIALNADLVKPVLWQEDLDECLLKEDSPALILLAAEGGELLGEAAQYLPFWFELGLRSLGLTWNYQNNLGHGCHSQGRLTPLGEDIIAKCNDCGILLDGAHLAEDSFWQLLALSNKSIIVSHTACQALRDHPRNLSDAQLRALAERGGVAGITFIPGFLKAENGDLDAVTEHILHGIQIAGIDHIGIGSDFDGGEICPRLKGLENLYLLWDELKSKGLSENDVEKIQGGNFYRILQENLPSKMNNR
ncbi:MAG: membrane dipeptidase [Clostridiales bacterium]